MAQLYINLPVVDLAKATDFYAALGFEKNIQFSNDQASAMIYDDTLSVMLLSHGFYRGFLPNGKTIAESHKTSEVLNALQFESRDRVDNFVSKALSAGAKKTIDAYDHGFMYGQDFEDPDGHIWEAFWMDASQMPKE